MSAYVKRSIDPDMSVESAARHEAGHAVMAIALGYKVSGAFVCADGTGGVSAGPGRGRRRDPLAEAMICWAGGIADGTAGTQISEGDALLMRAMRYRWSSIVALRELALRRYEECGMGPAVGAVAALLVANVGRRVAGAVIHEAALGAVPALADAAEDAR